LLDEALAVGDLNFKRRSIRRLNTLRDNATTIIVVSHNTQEIRRICDRTIWLDGGKLVRDGSTNDVIDAYEAAQNAVSALEQTQDDASAG